MKSNKKLGAVLITLGILMLLSAAAVVVYNTRQDKQSGEISREILSELKQEIPDVERSGKDVSADGTEPLKDSSSEPQEEKIQLDDRYYVGIVSIPSLDIELPVLSYWNYPDLQVSPCRYAGTVADGNLIIAAHNYSSHFGKIGDLSSGDEILFTECGGEVHRYLVEQTQLIDGHDIDSMFDGDEDWDITLFSCNWSGSERVTVRAVEQF